MVFGSSSVCVFVSKNGICWSSILVLYIFRLSLVAFKTLYLSLYPRYESYAVGTETGY